MRPLDASTRGVWARGRRAFMLMGIVWAMIAFWLASLFRVLPPVDLLLGGSIGLLAFALIGLGVGKWHVRRWRRALLAPTAATTVAQVLARAGARVRVRGTLGQEVTPAMRPTFRLRLEDGEVLVDESMAWAPDEEDGATFAEGDEIVVAGECEVRPTGDGYRGGTSEVVIGGEGGIQVARAR